MSAVISDQQSNNVAEFFSPGPGERLRAARLSMGYDLPKIASELHLTGSVVEALEADDYSGIEARVFVRGYLRNYARIVGMPVESILRQFDEKWPDNPSSQSMVKPSPRLPADGGPGRGLAGAVTWLLVIGLLVLFLMWWRGYLDGIVPENIRSAAPDTTDESASPNLFETEQFPSTQIDAVADDGSLRLPPAVPAGDEPAAVDSTGTAVIAPLLESADTAPSAATGVASGERSEIAPSVTTETVLPLSSGAETTLAVSEASATSTTVAPAPDGEVVMYFTAPCWVDVRDSERQFKLFGEMPKGTRKVLGGSPPYKMVIGNAQAVEITVDGAMYDLGRHAKGNVARFTLDPR
jgi:cytoskeleton protein RodZ